jgi:transcriptional regulator with XRE-family HTH domain
MRHGERISEEDIAVGMRLAAARMAAGLSQTEAAKRLGFAQSRIAKLEIGTRRLLFSEAIDLAEIYGVAVADFVPTEYGGRTRHGRLRRVIERDRERNRLLAAVEQGRPDGAHNSGVTAHRR